MRMEAQRVLNFFHLIVIGLGSSLGIGIYVVLGDVVKTIPGISFEVSVLLTGFTAFLAGLIYTEFAVWFIRANSSYTFFYACGNENFAFVLGWILILKHVAGTACVVKGVILFIDAVLENKISAFLDETVPLNTAYISSSFDFISVAVVIILTLLLAYGMKDNLILKSLFTVVNILLIVSIVVAGSFKVNIENWYVEESINNEVIRNIKQCDFVLVLKQAPILFIGFIGFDTVGLTGEEVKKRLRTIPAAVYLSIFLSLLAFFGVGNILLLINPFYKIISYASIPFAFEQAGWRVVKWVLVAGAFFGFQTSLFGIIYPLPTIITSLANDGILFHFLGKINDKTNTPLIATGISGLLIAVAAGFLTFMQLLSLTVISTLCLFNVFAISIILLRCTPNCEEEEPTAISTNSLYPFITEESSLNQPVSLKNIIKNLFNFKQKVTTNITVIIAILDLLLYGISSIALSILVIYYFAYIKSLKTAFVISSGVCLVVLFLTLVSLICQPKSPTSLFFKVPFTPLVPCLSILMNTLFSVSFGPISWTFFGIWLGIGTIPYLILYFLRCRQSLINECSIYEINKMNALKLNEAVWKIITERPSFYEGKVNPAFREEPDEKSEITRINDNGEKIKNIDEKIELKINKEYIFQTAEIVPEEKIEPLVVDGESISLNEEDKVNWQCVAEIHNSEEFSNESVVLEIVDTSYNFLNEGDSLSQKSIDASQKLEGSETKELSKENKGSSPTKYYKNTSPKPLDSEKVKRNYLQKKAGSTTPHLKKKVLEDDKSQSLRPTPMFSRKLLEEIHDTVRLKKERMKVQNNENLLPSKTDELNKNSEEKDSTRVKKEAIEPEVVKDEKKINLVIGPISDETKIINHETAKENEDHSEENLSSNEQSKVKDFKEKLNQLLKNQIDINSSIGKRFLSTKLMYDQSSETVSERQNSDDDDELYKTVKTLNKTQIKDKLELLLTKGPPKRPSLKGSFNIKNKENVEEEKREEAEVNNKEVTT